MRPLQKIDFGRTSYTSPTFSNGSTRTRVARPSKSGFTLVELLVTIAIIGILASLLLTAIGRAKEKARRTVCISNLKQLGQAFTMYLDNNADFFPASGSRTLFGPMPEDWVHWQQGRDVNEKGIAPYIGSGGVVANLLRCPVDRASIDLARNNTTNAYTFSYSFTSYALSNGVNKGMAMAMGTNGVKLPFNSNRVRNPSKKIMLVEEERGGVNGLGLNDARWIPENNALTERHAHKANVLFVDGHIQTVKPEFGRNITNSLPEL